MKHFNNINGLNQILKCISNMYTQYNGKRIIKTNNLVYKFEEIEIFSNYHTKTIMKRDYDIILFLVDCDRI